MTPSDPIRIPITTTQRGDPQHDLLMAEAVKAAAATLIHNTRIAAILNQARAEVIALGEPAQYMARGYGFRDAMDLLLDITPTFEPTMTSCVHRTAISSAFSEDAGR